jgi:hypothetical protein
VLQRTSIPQDSRDVSVGFGARIRLWPSGLRVGFPRRTGLRRRPAGYALHSDRQRAHTRLCHSRRLAPAALSAALLVRSPRGMMRLLYPRGYPSPSSRPECARPTRTSAGHAPRRRGRARPLHNGTEPRSSGAPWLGSDYCKVGNVDPRERVAHLTAAGERAIEAARPYWRSPGADRDFGAAIRYPLARRSARPPPAYVIRFRRCFH